MSKQKKTVTGQDKWSELEATLKGEGDEGDGPKHRLEMERFPTALEAKEKGAKQDPPPWQGTAVTITVADCVIQIHTEIRR